MGKGEANLSARELEKLAAMAKAAEKYEGELLRLRPSKMRQAIIEN